MAKPSPYDRDAPAGNEQDGEPEIAVFDDAAPAQRAAPQGSDPSSHDLYRRPTGPSRHPAGQDGDDSGLALAAADPATPDLVTPGPVTPARAVPDHAGPATAAPPAETVPWEPFDDSEAESWPGLLAREPQPDSGVAGAQLDDDPYRDSRLPVTGRPSAEAHRDPATDLAATPVALPSISDFWPDSTDPAPARSASVQPYPAEPYAPEPYAAEPYAEESPDGERSSAESDGMAAYPAEAQRHADQEYHAPESYPEPSAAPEPYPSASSSVAPSTVDAFTERKPFSPQDSYPVVERAGFHPEGEARPDDPYSRSEEPGAAAAGLSPLNRLLQPSHDADRYGADQYGPDQYRPDRYGSGRYDDDPYARDPHTSDSYAPGPYAADPYVADRFDEADELPIPVTAPVGAASVKAPRSGRRRRRLVRAGLLVALLLLAGTGVGLAVLSTRSAGPAANTAAERSAGQAATGEQTGGGAADSSGNAISAPLNGRTEAVFDVVNGTTTMNLRTADLGEELYRISTPDGSSVVPQATEQDGRVQLFLVRSGQQGAGAVDIALNAAVQWDLRVTGGVEQSLIDMSGSRVKGVNLAGGATRIELKLPRPDGTLKVRMTGGVNQFLVNTADPVPVRVRVGSGAGQLVLDGRTHNGIAPGALFTPEAWDDGGDRVDLEAIAGMATLTVNED